MDGKFALFNVAPGTKTGMDELAHLLAGEPQKEAVWDNETIVRLLVDRFTNSFHLFGCAGSFTDDKRHLMAEAVLNLAYQDGSVIDSTGYFQSSGDSRIVRVSPQGEFEKTVLLQGYAVAGDFKLLAQTTVMEVSADSPMSLVIPKVLRSLGIAGNYAAFQLEISGGCTVRAAYSHPTEQQVSAQVMFSKYVHVSTMGNFVFYGVTTPTDYTRLSGHFHGASQNGIVGGHLTKVLAGSTIKIWGYEPTPEQIVQITY